MDKVKVQLSDPYPIRIPVNVVEDLKKVAAKNQRSFSQELRYRVLQAWGTIPKAQFK